MQTEKLYDQNAYLRSFTATVLSCEPIADPKKRADDAAYAVTLDRTAFFPEAVHKAAVRLPIPVISATPLSAMCRR